MGGRLDSKTQQPLDEELVRPAWMDKPVAVILPHISLEVILIQSRVDGWSFFSM